jgi:hypothetical protein
VRIGADYQFGRIVVGGEADFDAAFASQAITVGTASGTEQIPWLGTSRARLGARVEYLYFGSGGDLTLASVGPPTVNVSGRVQENVVGAGLNLRLPISR